jgi:hypothetical protein
VIIDLKSFAGCHVDYSFDLGFQGFGEAEDLYVKESLYNQGCCICFG